MIPVWAQSAAGPINLGGSAPPASTHADILDQAKARRQEREDQRRRRKALCVCRRGAGRGEARSVRSRVRERFFEVDVRGVEALRCWCLLGGMRSVGKWAGEMVSSGEGKSIGLESPLD